MAVIHLKGVVALAFTTTPAAQFGSSELEPHVGPGTRVTHV